jgi:hypothetical protein
LSKNTSINESNINFKLYPNPAKDYIIVLSNNNAEITIYNSFGELILEKVIQTGTTKINIANFCNGIYFIVSRDDKKLIGKFVKNQ